MATDKKKGKPKIQLDVDDIRELASEGNTVEDVASLLGVSAGVISENVEYKTAYELGLCDMRAMLRHAQFQSAKSGNTTMLVWLGKVLLGQREETVSTLKFEREDDELTKSLQSLATEMDSNKKQDGQ